MMMNNLKWAIAAGTAALSFAALPSQAASVFTTTSNVGGTVSPAAAYRIEDLQVLLNGTTTTYNVDFDHGEFSDVFPAAPQYFFDSADAVGEAIVRALGAVPVSSVVERLTNGNFGADIVSQFYIPITSANANGGEHFLSVCQIGGAFTTACNSEPRNLNGPLMYAKFSAAAPGGGGSTDVPTPALLPGLLGMGAAVLRRKKQAAEEIAA